MKTTPFQRAKASLPLIQDGKPYGTGTCSVHGPCNIGTHGKCNECVKERTFQFTQEGRSRQLCLEEPKTTVVKVRRSAALLYLGTRMGFG